MSELRQSSLPGRLLLLDQLLAVLVHLKLRDDHIGRVKWDESGFARKLLNGHRFDGDPHGPELDSRDTAVPALELATDDLNLIIAADREPLDAMGLLEVL